MSSQGLIVNELLAFVQHAIDTMDEVSIVQICKSNFKEEEICSGKALLYETLGKTDRMPSRRRDGGAKSVQDIIVLLKETDPDDVPAFVAKQLHKLPPVTFDHVDVTRLLKDIVALKASLEEMSHKFESSQNVIAELRNDVNSLRNAPVTRPSADASNLCVVEPTHADAPASGIKSALPQRELSTPQVVRAAPPPARPPRVAQPPVRAPCVSELASNKQPKARGYADVAGKAVGLPRSNKEGALPTSGERPSISVDKEGFTLVQKRNKARRKPCKSQCGTASLDPNSGLQAATPNTALYVSRLHYSTSVDDVVGYVSQKTGYTLEGVSAAFAVLCALRFFRGASAAAAAGDGRVACLLAERCHVPAVPGRPASEHDFERCDSTEPRCFGAKIV